MRLLNNSICLVYPKYYVNSLKTEVQDYHMLLPLYRMPFESSSYLASRINSRFQLKDNMTAKYSFQQI